MRESSFDLLPHPIYIRRERVSHQLVKQYLKYRVQRGEQRKATVFLSYRQERCGGLNGCVNVRETDVKYILELGDEIPLEPAYYLPMIGYSRRIITVYEEPRVFF